LNRPGQTAERFIPHPFDPDGGGRLYRTGDLARYSADGVLEYAGRRDLQVKVRGFRVEVGEIEAVLKQHGSVKQAVVTVREDEAGRKRLVAYIIVAQASAPPTSAELRRHLKDKLPEYMIPSLYIRLDALPLTGSGKVDRRALPAPEPGQEEREEEYVPPRNVAEELLASIWSEVLGGVKVGVEDNFFELGGHSLLATQVVSRVREAFGVEVGLRSLFERPTVGELAGQIAEGLGAGAGGGGGRRDLGGRRGRGMRCRSLSPSSASGFSINSNRAARSTIFLRRCVSAAQRLTSARSKKVYAG
jgi:acyl carrier protein